MVHVKFIAHDELFRAVFTRCPDDPLVWLLDVRSQNKFKRGHIMSAFCIRATANGETLLVSSCCYNLLLQSALFHQIENSLLGMLVPDLCSPQPQTCRTTHRMNTTSPGPRTAGQWPTMLTRHAICLFARSCPAEAQTSYCRWGKPVIVYGDAGLRKDHSGKSCLRALVPSANLPATQSLT